MTEVKFQVYFISGESIVGWVDSEKSNDLAEQIIDKGFSWQDSTSIENRRIYYPTHVIQEVHIYEKGDDSSDGEDGEDEEETTRATDS
jgi:hypothetical protein